MTGASAAVPAAPTAREVTAGARSTYAVFAGLGLAGSTWSSRLPEVRTQLNRDSASLGLLLLTIAVGGVIVLPLSGTVVTRIGPRRAVTVVALLVGASLGVISLGYALSASLLVAGLFLLGAATGFWDVAMTVHAAAVERQLGRPVMPRFFAAFSLGTVAGAAVGVLMTALRVPVSIHVAVVAAVIAGAIPAAARHFLPEHAARPIAVPPPARMSRPGLGAWREPRALAVGLVALAFAVAEGGVATGSASRSSTVTTSPPRSARWRTPPSSPRSPPAAGSGQRSSTGSDESLSFGQPPPSPPPASPFSRLGCPLDWRSREVCSGGWARRSAFRSA